MTWLVIIAGVFFVGWLFRPRQKSAAVEMQLDVSDQRGRAALLSSEEQAELAAECRQVALDAYDRGSARALAAGKNAAFAHQSGILEAFQTTLANQNRGEVSVTRALQMEAIPFNGASEELGRRAAAEYLVWKFFPASSVTTPVQSVVSDFVSDIFARNSGDDKFIYEMIYSAKWDWQKFAIEEVRNREAAQKPRL